MVRRGVHGSHHGVPWRSHEVSRIEALSDAVFAFAVTLLVVALEVPETFTDLLEKMRGLPAFALSFASLFQVWYAQNIFFRRYGLQDVLTLVLNGLLLFLVLFYMYPMKFLFALLTSQFTGHSGLAHLRNGEAVPMIASADQGRLMMLIFNLGFGGVFLVFVLLYWHAWHKRHELELTAEELYDTRETIESHLIMVTVALVSTLILWLTRNAGLAGLTYCGIFFAQTIHGALRGRKRRLRFGQ